MSKPKDADLTLAEVEHRLTGFFTRLQAIKAEAIALRQQRPTRDEVASGLSAWLDSQTATASGNLFSRLVHTGFLIENDAHTQPGVLFAEGPLGYANQAVTATGLLPFIAPAIREYFTDWVANIPDNELGALPKAEVESRLAALDAERLEILARRNQLQSRVRQVESAGKVPAETIKVMTSGGTLTNPDFSETLEQKYFAGV